MATIQKLMNKKGVSYRVQIRRKGLPNIFKTFTHKQDARRFALRIEESKSAHRAYSSKLTFSTLAGMYLSNEYLGTKPQMQRSRLKHWLNHMGEMPINDIGKDQEKMSRIKTLALHGMSKDAWSRFSDDGYKHYKVEMAGFKYNMPDVQAAIGIHQLKKIDKFYKKREKIWSLYQKEFENLPITLPYEIEVNTRHAYHLFNICLDQNKTNIRRDEFLNKMNENKIGVGVHYESIPVHPYYQKTFNWNPLDYPNALKFGKETVSIPISPRLSNNDLDKIIDVTKRILNE